MKIPLGRPNCFHSSRNLPSWSKISIRLFPRSATNNRPWESMAMACNSANSPGPDPFFPQALRNLPSLDNFTIRAFESPPCPSATKMVPLGATTTAEGRLKVSSPAPATPALPSASRTFPSGLNLKTCWPLPSLPWPSVAHTFPSLSTEKPCGKINIPAPKLFTSLPEESNLRMGASFEPAHVSPPHRSKAQTLPPRSTATPMTAPNFLPWGSFAQFSTR